MIHYLGIRPQTSIEVHKKFANIENLTIDECPNPRPKPEKLDKNDKKDGKAEKMTKVEKQRLIAE